MISYPNFSAEGFARRPLAIAAVSCGETFGFLCFLAASTFANGFAAFCSGICGACGNAGAEV